MIRFGPYPNGLDREFTSDLKVPNPRSKKVVAALTAVDRGNLVDGKYLVKYGKRAHLTEMLHNGIVRISPASAFAEPSLNDAIRDTELEFSYFLYKLTHEDLRPYLKNIRSSPYVPEGSAIITQTSKEDFYLFCLSASYDPRLFDDFDADACLLIKDPIAFRDTLLWTVHNVLDVRGHAFSAVTYVDPMTDTGEEIHFALRKKARYAYQDEVRAVWLAKDQTAPLQVQFVRLGSLEDIAQLVFFK